LALLTSQIGLDYICIIRYGFSIALQSYRANLQDISSVSQFESHTGILLYQDNSNASLVDYRREKTVISMVLKKPWYIVQ
jgi:hypothetical protein